MGGAFPCQTRSFFAPILTGCRGNRRGMVEKGRSDIVQRLCIQALKRTAFFSWLPSISQLTFGGELFYNTALRSAMKERVPRFSPTESLRKLERRRERSRGNMAPERRAPAVPPARREVRARRDRPLQRRIFVFFCFSFFRSVLLEAEGAKRGEEHRRSGRGPAGTAGRKEVVPRV